MIIYLASPYTDPDPLVMETRHQLVCELAGRLMCQGHHIFSPIAHCHIIARTCQLPTDYTFWEEYDRKLLSVCGELWVMVIPGWMRSKGVAAEIAIARELNLPIRYIGPYDLSPRE